MNQQSMHRRIKKKGVEYDVASRYARSVLCFLRRAGATAYWKNQMNRRERRLGRAQARQYRT